MFWLFLLFLLIFFIIFFCFFLEDQEDVLFHGVSLGISPHGELGHEKTPGERSVKICFQPKKKLNSRVTLPQKNNPKKNIFFKKKNVKNH